MRLALAIALAFFASCSEADTDGPTLAAGAPTDTPGSDVVRIDPYEFDPVVDALFSTENAIRVRASGPPIAVEYSLVQLDADRQEIGRRELGYQDLIGDLDRVVIVEMQTTGTGDEARRTIVLREATLDGRTSRVSRSPVDDYFPASIRAFGAGSVTSPREVKRGAPFILREWDSSDGSESWRFKVEMTVKDPD